ncbi:hypothetical protein GCM10007162_08350 [Ignatzschineria ureiclastica]|nr:NirD/YgiW/YdeI family stress tolerance protein [Ignatzschineria ureiclastica]GGZ94774.1 hypothetical protein GCM10007162_08350 [Ignatzschineria ureiclastica]
MERQMDWQITEGESSCIDKTAMMNQQTNQRVKMGVKTFFTVIAGVIFSLALNAISEPVWAMEGHDLPTDSNPEEEIAINFDIRQNNGATLVEDALYLDDEMRVTLQGQIVEQIGKDRYRFKDSSGEMVLEIEGDEWYGIEVTPEDTILVQGEIERSGFQPATLDVDFLLKLE